MEMTVKNHTGTVSNYQTVLGLKIDMNPDILGAVIAVGFYDNENDKNLLWTEEYVADYETAMAAVSMEKLESIRLALPVFMGGE